MSPERPRAAGAWIRWVPTALVVLDAVLLAAIWHWASREGWRLVGDDAIIVFRASDVFTAHPPLTGMPSAFNQWSAVAAPFHPGPTPFWVLAPLTALLGASEPAALLTTFAITVGCTALIAAIAQRIAGPAVAAAAVVATLFLQVTLIYRPLWTPLTPIPATMQLLALCFVTWAIVVGRLRWWPVWALLASLVAHADLSFATTVAGLGAAALGSTIRIVRQRRRAGRPRDRRTPVLTVGVFVVCWSPLLLDALRHDGGNLRELWRASRAGLPVAGVARAGFGLVYVLSGRVAAPGTSDAVAAAIVVVALLGLVALGVVGWRAGSRHAAPLALVSGSGLLGALLAQALTPEAAGLQALYLLSLEALGTFTWFAIAVAARDGITALLARPAPPARRWRLPVLALLVAAFPLQAALSSTNVDPLVLVTQVATSLLLLLLLDGRLGVRRALSTVRTRPVVQVLVLVATCGLLLQALAHSGVSVRVGTHAPDVWRNVDRIQATAEAADRRLTLSFCLMRENWREALDLVHEADQRGAYANVIFVNQPERHDLLRLPPTELAEVLAELRSQPVHLAEVANDAEWAGVIDRIAAHLEAPVELRVHAPSSTLPPPTSGRPGLDPAERSALYDDLHEMAGVEPLVIETGDGRVERVDAPTWAEWLDADRWTGVALPDLAATIERSVGGQVTSGLVDSDVPGVQRLAIAIDEADGRSGLWVHLFHALPDRELQVYVIPRPSP